MRATFTPMSLPRKARQMPDAASQDAHALVELGVFEGLCEAATFAPGETLRVKGRHYWNMYLITSGEAEVRLAKKGRAQRVVMLGRGSPVGEIGFLTGRPATADVTATSPVEALVVDDAIMAEIERRHPHAAAELYRHLANVAEGRQSFNLLYLSDGAPAAAATTADVEVRLCRSPDMLAASQRLRYEVYCEELGRTSPFADPERRILADDLDAFAHVLLAVDAATGEPVGTIRMNASRDGPLGALEEVYGMRENRHHPAQTGVCTKFIVKKSHRYGQASFRLMATSVEFGARFKIRYCYGDCIPSLLPFYRALGFRQAAPAFLHRENGRSIPLAIDLEKYASRIARLSGFALR